MKGIICAYFNWHRKKLTNNFELGGGKNWRRPQNVVEFMVLIIVGRYLNPKVSKHNNEFLQFDLTHMPQWKLVLK